MFVIIKANYWEMCKNGYWALVVEERWIYKLRFTIYDLGCTIYDIRIKDGSWKLEAGSSAESLKMRRTVIASDPDGYREYAANAQHSWILL